MQTHTAVGVELRIIGGVLSAIVSLPTSVKGKVSGLLGNWDDNVYNDFQLPNDTIIPIDSSPVDIHNNFGMAWASTSFYTFAYPYRLA